MQSCFGLTNWSDALFQNSAKTNANINFSGGSDKSDYFFSVGYLDEEGTAKFTGYKRFNTRLSVNTAATSWLNMLVLIWMHLLENTKV
jgi:hypothetical protein